MLVTGTDAEIALKRLTRLVPERQGALAAALAEHQEHVQIEVDVGQLQIGQFGPAGLYPAAA